MKKTQLIDMFGMSGDSSDDDELDSLLFCLEHDDPQVLESSSANACLSFVTIPLLKPKKLFPILKGGKKVYAQRAHKMGIKVITSPESHLGCSVCK
jgi:hypothetical protein